MFSKSVLPIAVDFLPHFVNEILPKIKLDKKIKKEFELSIPEKKVESTDDPVKSYLNTIAFHSLLKKSEEVDVASKLSIAKNHICESIVSDLDLLEYLGENYLSETITEDQFDYDIENSEYENKSLKEIIIKSRDNDDGIFNNAGQNYNHIIFWQSMTPKYEGPSQEIQDHIEDSFRSID